MSKFYSLVAILAISFSAQSYANDDLLMSNFKTKQIVRLKLWYEGLENAPEETQQNQELSSPELKEELSRVIDRFES
jgi:hypothetical protein